MEVKTEIPEIGTPEFYKLLAQETEINMVETAYIHTSFCESDGIKHIPETLLEQAAVVFETANNEANIITKNKLTDLAYMYSEIVKSTVHAIYGELYAENKLIPAAFKDIGLVIETNEDNKYDPKEFLPIERASQKIYIDIRQIRAANNLDRYKINDILKQHNMKLSNIFDTVMKQRKNQPESTKKILNNLNEIAETTLSLYKNQETLSEIKLESRAQYL